MLFAASSYRRTFQKAALGTVGQPYPEEGPGLESEDRGRDGALCSKSPVVQSGLKVMGQAVALPAKEEQVLLTVISGCSRYPKAGT